MKRPNRVVRWFIGISFIVTVCQCPCVSVVRFASTCFQSVRSSVCTLRSDFTPLPLLLLVEHFFFFAFIRFTHQHTRIVRLCFCIYIFCVVFVCFKYFILTLLWSNGPARRISRDVLLESVTSKKKINSTKNTKTKPKCFFEISQTHF